MKWLRLTYYCFTILLSMAILFESCSPDDNPYPSQYEGKVKVNMNWQATSDTRPEGMSVLFYPVNGNPFWRFELNNEGGTVSLPFGIYNVLAYNNDTSSILFENADEYGNAIITTNKMNLDTSLQERIDTTNNTQSATHTELPLVQSPDDMWGANTYTYDTQGFARNLTLYIHRLVSNYKVCVLKVENGESCYQASFTISGVSAGRYLSSMELIPSEVAIAGKLTTATEFAFAGMTKAFGRLAGRGKCWLDICFMLRDGTKKFFQYDVTSVVENAEDPFNVEIDVDEIRLPIIESSSPDSGLDVGLDDWETVEIEISND